MMRMESMECFEEILCESSVLRIDEVALRMIRLRGDNLKRLERLRDAIEVEEEKMLSVDEVLARVLDFYGSFVPFECMVQ